MKIIFIIVMKTRRRPCLREQMIVKTEDSMVAECTCGNFHVYSGTLHIILTPEQFDRTARLLKMALGSLTAQNCNKRFHPQKPSSGIALCLECGQTLKFDCKSTDQHSNKVAKQHGFSLAGTSLRIFGYCAWCRTASKLPT